VPRTGIDIPTSSSMLPVMETLASFLSCKLGTYTIKSGSGLCFALETKEVLSLSVTAIDKLEFIVNYSNKQGLLGVKVKDYKH